jgi:hypothetical protein
MILEWTQFSNFQIKLPGYLHHKLHFHWFISRTIQPQHIMMPGFWLRCANRRHPWIIGLCFSGNKSPVKSPDLYCINCCTGCKISTNRPFLIGIPVICFLNGLFLVFFFDRGGAGRS